MRTLRTLIILLLSINYFAISATLEATLDRNPVVQGQNFRVEFSVDERSSNFTPPSFSGFNVLQGPNQSQSTQIMNGQMSFTQTYTYILSAKKKGTYFIGPAKVTVDGKRIASKRIKITVTEPSEAEKQRRANAEQQEKDLTKQANELIKKNLYIKTSVNKSKAYEGEQIVASYKLYVHPDLNVVNLEHSLSPTFDGFWTQEIDMDANNWTREVIDGIPFKVALIKKVILYPQRPGKLEIKSMEFNSTVRLPVSGGNQRRRRSMFDSFFDRGNYKNFEYKIRSPKRTINVTELPQPEPQGFTEGVGSLKIESWFDNTKTKTNEPVTFKVKISGDGNLKLLSPPDIAFPPDFEIYEPKVVDNVNVTSSGSKGNVQFEYLIIPRNSGEFKIDPIEFSWFDIKSRSYQTHTSEEYAISVAKGDGINNNSVIQGFKKENLKFIGKDVRFIKTETNLITKSPGLFSSSKFWISLLAPFMVFFIVLFLKKNSDKRSSNTKLVKNKQASKIIKKRFSQAKSNLSEGNNNAFFEEMTKAIWDYFSDKLSIPASDLNKDNVKEILLKNDLLETDIDDILKVIEECELARYAPVAIESSVEGIYEKASLIIEKFEAKL